MKLLNGQKFVFVLFAIPLYGQPHLDLQPSDQPFELGGSVKFTFEVQKFSNFRLSLTGGIGKRVEGLEFIYPAAHLEMQLYNGGIGSSLLYSRQRRLTADFVASVLITGGVRQVRPDGFAERYSPLNFFSDLSATPLQNPYYNSISLGSNYVVSTNKDRENQLVGVFNLNAERIVQVTYYNDGTPFGNWIGDGYDRYYTGGGMLSYYGKYTDEVNIAELTYHKFTGYQRAAFETANHMQIDFIPYRDIETFYYNQSRWRVKVGNYQKGYSLLLSMYDNQKWDAQDFIHYTIDNGYHPDAYHATRFAIGGEYNYVNYISK